MLGNCYNFGGCDSGIKDESIWFLEMALKIL